MGKLPISRVSYITACFCCNRRMTNYFGKFVIYESKHFRCDFSLSKLLSFVILIDLQNILELKQAIKIDSFSYGKYWISSTIFLLQQQNDQHLWKVFDNRKMSAFMKSFGYLAIQFSFACYIEFVYN